MTSVSHLTIGLDLGDNNSDVCVLDQQRREIERRPVKTAPESLKALFERYPGADVVFEVGSQSRWVQQLAKESNMGTVIAADPRQLKLISASRSKNDRKDAYVLCRAAQGLPEMLHPVEHRSEEAHLHLQLLRSRDLLVQQRTALVNRIRGMAKATGSKLPSGDAQYFFRKAPEKLPEPLRKPCAPLFAILAAIHEQLLLITAQVRQLMKNYAAAQLLTTIPSVGDLTALTFVLTIDDPNRIRGARNIAALLGITPRKKESGDSTPQLGITKAGDSNMRRLLVLCAHHLLSRGKDCRLKQWGLQLCQRGGSNAKKRAVVAVARKLAVHMLAIWKSGETYDPWRDVPAEMMPAQAS